MAPATKKTPAEDGQSHRTPLMPAVPPVSSLLGALPEHVAPMLAVARHEPFDSSDHVFEVWWEGLRVAAFVESGHVSLRTQSHLDLTPHFPEIASLVAKRSHYDGMVFDGILTAPDAKGVPRLSPLLRRIHAQGAAAREITVHFQVFDVLYREYRPLFRYPLLRRKHTLHETLDTDDVVQISHYEEGAGIAFFEAATRLGLPGAVAKDKTSLYTPGRRSPAWVQIRANREATVVIGGYTLAESGRKEPFGSLLLGLHGDEGLRYAGTVSGGFQKEDIDIIAGLLKAAHTGQSPFVDPPRMGHLLYWCQPTMAVRVSYGEVSAAGQMQFAIFKGLRPDVDPRTCFTERLGTL